MDSKYEIKKYNFPFIFFHAQFPFSIHLFHLFWKQTGEFFRKCIFLLLFTIICNNVRELYMQCNYDAIFLDNKKFKRNRVIFFVTKLTNQFFFFIFFSDGAHPHMFSHFSLICSHIFLIFSLTALSFIFSHVFSDFSLIVLTIICDECFRDADATASILENLGERNVHKM